jgi:oligopeptide/dipeptide ABC transporter ATP-binding protein
MGLIHQVFGNAAHPYTQALLSAVPSSDLVLDKNRTRVILPCDPPSPFSPPSSCSFRTRCPAAIDKCALERPVLKLINTGQKVACHLV